MHPDLIRLRDRLSASPGRDLDHPELAGFTPSAVVVPLYLDGDGLGVLLTKRSALVQHHKGQISFPGGRFDPEDESLRACALRETREEIGLPPDRVRLLGRLDATPVITGYLLTPFVAEIPRDFEFVPSPDEIERLLFIPLRRFMDPALHRAEPRSFLGRPFPLHFFDIDGEVVWGATARVLVNLLKVGFDFEPPAS